MNQDRQFTTLIDELMGEIVDPAKVDPPLEYIASCAWMVSNEGDHPAIASAMAKIEATMAVVDARPSSDGRMSGALGVLHDLCGIVLLVAEECRIGDAIASAGIVDVAGLLARSEKHLTVDELATKATDGNRVRHAIDCLRELGVLEGEPDVTPLSLTSSGVRATIYAENQEGKRA